MISLILPYWERQEAADIALRLLAQTYPDLDMEVVVVDDGNPVPFAVPDVPLNIRVVRLPEKQIAKCPATAWNAGAAASTGEIIVLSCIEILHKMPVLEELASAVRNIGPLGYVLAAAWCPEDGSWHCHSTTKTPRNPEGTGIAFCGAMHRELFAKAGGFDEDYREGAGYEDNDFINRMLMAGARFVIRDDLVVTHPKTGASIAWGAERFARNEALYYSKWPTELRLNAITFCCVNSGNYLGRGREYVEKLYAMLLCCLPDGLAFKFLCFTDEPFDHDGIQCRPLPAADLLGWNQKIALFRPDLFADGERVVFLDLDTLLIGRIDRLLDYQGEFATLRDFRRPEGLGPAVMLWRGGFGAWIWEKYERADFPQLERGDQEWLQAAFSEEGYQPDLLQDMYPGLLCSYKDDCNPNPPANARIVCFHGTPRPHDAAPWALACWNGEVTGSALEQLCNVELQRIIKNIHSSTERGIRCLEQVPGHNGKAVLVGGGPSMADSIEQIRAAVDAGATVIAMNGTSDYLADHGITPHIHIAVDARESNLRFVQRRNAASYYLASQCHPALFDHIPDATLFHVALMDWEKYIQNTDRAMALGGGHTVGLYAMSLAYVLGYRDLHLYGYDSSYQESHHHAYAQPKNDADPIISAHFNGREFKTTAWMVVQVNEFRDLSRQLAQMDCTITTYGYGLLPYVAWQSAAMLRQAEEQQQESARQAA